MARRDAYTCDSCGNPIKGNPLSLMVVTERYLSGAGSWEDEDHQVDLCPFCCIRELRAFVKGLGHAESRDWLQRVGKYGSWWLKSIGYVGKR